MSAPQICVQATHSAIEVVRNSLIPAHYDHPSVIICGIDGESKLHKTLAHIQSLGIICKPFYENLFDNQLTAFATEPILEENRHHFRKYQLIRNSHFRERSIV